MRVYEFINTIRKKAEGETQAPTVSEIDAPTVSRGLLPPAEEHGAEVGGPSETFQ